MIKPDPHVVKKNITHSLRVEKMNLTKLYPPFNSDSSLSAI